MSKTTNEWRVKLYQLENGSIWQDKGTGYVSCYQIPSEKDSRIYNAYIVVRKEEDHQSYLLKSQIIYEEAYERQGESIIMWRQRGDTPNQNVDYALSFQEVAGCFAVWETILDIQALSCNLLKSTGLDQDQYELQYSLSPEPSQESNSLLLGLPSVTKENLDIIKIRITSCLVPQRDVFASLVLDQNGQYIRQLLALSQELELSGDIGSCAKIAEIIKGIVFLNSPAIVEFIIADDIYQFVAGAMEFDPSMRGRPLYREIVAKNPTGPKCVLGLNFGQPHVQPLVQKLYRLKLLKDLMIRPLLDDVGAAAMNNMINSVQTSICNDIFGDSNYFRRLLQEINSSSCLEVDEEIDSLNGPLNISRATTDSTILDYPEENEIEDDARNDEESNSPLTEEEKYQKLLRIRDCLGLLRELFFMSRQTLAVEQRIDLYLRSIQPMRSLFFTSLKKILCLRTVALSPNISHLGDDLKLSILVKPDHQAILSSMRVMASEILTTCTLVCPYLIRLSIMEGSVPYPPLSQSSTPKPINPSFSSEPLDEIITNTSPSNISPSHIPYPRYPALEYQSQSILFVIIERILCDDEVVVVEQLGETLKIILDPDRIDKTEKEKFFSLIYDFYMSWLLLPFTLTEQEPDIPLNILSSLSHDTSSSPSPSPSYHSYSTSLSSYVSYKFQNSSSIYASRRYVCEIISSCILTHGYRIKTYLTRSNLLSKFLRLLLSKSRYYHIYSIKLIKNILILKDEQYNRYIVKNNLLKPIFELFVTLYHKDNMITSTIIDLIEFIRLERIQILIYYIVEKLKYYYINCLSPGSVLDLLPGESTSGGGGTSGGSATSIGPCQEYYTELFERLEVTYAQLKEYEEEKYRNERFDENRAAGTSHHNNTSTATRKRGPPGRSLNEIDSEDSYFEDDLDDEDDSAYGPVPSHSPSPSSSSTSNGTSSSSPNKKGSYFSDLRSNISTKKSKSSNGMTSTSKTISPLSLISDLYDGEDEDEHDNRDKGDYHENNISKDHQSDGFDLLPPLKSKFASDDDDDEHDFSQVFLHTPHHTINKSSKTSSSSGTSGTIHGGNGSNSPTTTTTAVSGGISFSIMNKKQRLL